MKILLILEEIIFGAGLGNINKMIGNMVAVDHIVGKILTSTNIHTSVNLSRVGTDYLASGSQC